MFTPHTPIFEPVAAKIKAGECNGYSSEWININLPKDAGLAVQEKLFPFLIWEEIEKEPLRQRCSFHALARYEIILSHQ